MTTHEAKHLNSATLIMGISGSGKSSLLATYAIWIWKTWSKVTLFYSVDGGGFPALVQELIDLGIIRIWRCRTRSGDQGELAFETCQRATQGWWPSKIDAQTGETEPSIRLVPPVTQRYEQYCPNGHLLKTVPFQKLLTAQICTKCKEHTTVANQKVLITTARTKGFENVGGAAYDGITSMCSWGMSDLAHRVGTRELKGEEGSLGGKLVSGDMSWGANNRSHYGFTQQRAEEFVTNTMSIPHLVAPPIFTALTLETTERGGLPIVGPALAGQAKTGDAGQWFGNTFEATKATNAQNKDVFRLYLSEFMDDYNRRHLCKHRGGPIGVPKYVDDPGSAEEGAPFTTFNLGHVFDLLTESRKLAMAPFGDDLANAPGVKTAPDDYGEPVVVKEAGAAPAASTPTPGAPKAAPKARARAPKPKADALPVVGPTLASPPAPPAPAPVPVTGPPKPEAAPAPAPAPRPKARAAKAATAGPATAPRPAPPAARPPAAAPRRRPTTTT